MVANTVKKPAKLVGIDKGVMIMELKEKCKLARKYMKMSQEQFGKVIKSNQTEVSFIERGFIPEDKKKIEKIEVIYKWSLE